MSELLERGRARALEVEKRITALLEGRSLEDQAGLVALLERGAAGRYRAWAEQADDAAERDGLLACAAREEGIAGRVEALAGHPPPPADLERLRPGLQDLARITYGDQPREVQLATQAAAERVGAALWRRFAASDPERAADFEACAQQEEASAAWLEALLARG